MNNQLQAFQDFIAAQTLQIPVWGFIVNLLLAALLAHLLGLVYIRYGTALSNRKAFASNFVLLAMTTTLVITIIKTSLALSLGMVGALSIVRFRAAIKDPEELTFLFLNIAIGLGLGAEQRVITMTAFVFFVLVMWLRKQKGIEQRQRQTLYLTVATRKTPKLPFERIVETLKGTCSAVHLKRFEETKDFLDAAFLVEFDDFNQLNKSRMKLQELDDALQITFLDQRETIA